MLAHLYAADWGWLQRWKGTSPTKLPGDDIPSLTALRGIERVTRERTTYWIALACVVAAIALVYLFLRSKQGLALLAIRDNKEHAGAMQAHGIKPIDLLVVNLYPFEETVAKGAGFDTCIENIDIGGPAMIRSAAKNHDSVTIVVRPEDYETVLAEIREGFLKLPAPLRIAS